MNTSPRCQQRSHGIIVVVAAVALLAACRGPVAATPPSASGTPIPGRVIELEMTATLKIRQAGSQVSTLTVKQGETYTFRITNSAGFDHDFRVGTDEQLRIGGHDLPGLMPFSAGTKEFSYTFDTDGALAFGCTIPGHYALMKGTFAVVP